MISNSHFSGIPSSRWGFFQRALLLFLSAAVCTALVDQTIYAQAATSAAEEAYREVSARNYAAAIAEFRKALEVEPSNARWRKDLAFACLAAGDTGGAFSEFQQAYAEDPEDSLIALQLGYVARLLQNEEDAQKYFEDATRSAIPQVADEARKALYDFRLSQLRNQKRKAYELLAQKRTREATKLFERIHEEDPADSSVTMQLGYLYASVGNAAEAKQAFVAARAEGDIKVIGQAQAALDEIRRDFKPWFASIYVAPFYQSRFSNEVNPLTARVGLKPSRYFEPYLGLRFNRDVRSDTGTLPQIYSDNTAVLSAGLQSDLANTGLVLYAEAGIALNLLNQGPRAVPDYRGGLRWFRSWGRPLVPPRGEPNGLSHTGSVYADAAYYTRYGDNFIGYLQVREGASLPTSRVLPLQLLAAVNLAKDSRELFYNNVVEAGPELCFAPLRRAPGLSFEVQYLRGFYAIHDPTNPYGPRYDDFRLSLIWSRNF